ncbi:DegT/DnrJ/EryC1/StrS family aminotransferase [Hydrogenophaga sp.]|uniref:DegT/DnrJ/EryC1/StrS family aminotransferase n=1 Tax=Hydrogenophaga sp. TaxID=1904254 RepID=UPI002FC5C9FC
MKRQPIAFADWSGREYTAIARCLLSGRVHQGPHPALLRERLAQMYAPSAVHLANYGHHAIEIALGIFKRQRPERVEVIVPAYICPSVIQAVEACGLRVRSVDVQDDLNMSPADVKAALGADTLAVIAPHMYGCPSRMGEIEALCDSTNVFLIDDAAQVVGVRQDGRLLGTFGDVGLISFAQSKTIVTGIRGSGGVLLVNRPAWAEQANRACAALPPASGRLGPLADFLWNHVGHVYTGHSGYYLGRALAALGRSPVAHQQATQISHLEAGIALAQLGRLDALLLEKVRIAQAYHQALQAYPLLRFPQFAPGRFLARVMLLLPEGTDLEGVRREARSRGLETRTGYAAHVAPGAEAPKAQAMAKRLLGVPCRPGMSQADVRSICEELNASVERVASR